MEMITPKEYVGPLIDLAQTRRGELKNMVYLTEERTSLVYDMPLAEVVTDFFDELKSRSRGYASMEYALTDYRKNDLVKLDVRINGEIAEPLALICHRDNAYRVGKALANSLKELIPRQMFRIPIQACIGAKAIASAAIPPYRKDVLAKCYGGDVSRKKKLLKKQVRERSGCHGSLSSCLARRDTGWPRVARGRMFGSGHHLFRRARSQAAGKKRMKQFGKVEVPQSAFMAVLNVNKTQAGGEE